MSITRALIRTAACMSAGALSAVAAQAGAEPAASPAAVADAPIVTAPATSVAEVVVKGRTIRPEQSAFSVYTFNPGQIRAKRIAKVEQLFRDVPGTFVSDYNLGGVASPIVIRGFGAGGHGGDLGIVIDGIPLNEAVSHADGYVDLSVVIPLEVGAFTVYKGPVAALYGNFNRGGLIALETRKGGDYGAVDLRYGSFNTLDAQAAFGAKIDDRQQINLAAQAFYTDGFRPQSDGYRLTFAGRYSVDLTDKLNLALSTRLHKADFNDPSYLNIKYFQVDPDQLNPGVQNDRATKQFGTFRVDLNYRLSQGLKLLTFAYTTQQDFARAYSRPINTALVYNQRDETYQREVYGTGASLNGHGLLLGRPVNFVGGVEYYSEGTAYQFYDGLINLVHTAPAIDDRRSTLKTISGFGEAQISLHRLLDLSLGLRVDNFTGDCTKKGPETTSDPCGPLNEITPVSPKIGLRSQILPWLQLRASHAEGFSLPSAFIKYAAGAAGVDVTGLEQNEVGAKLSPVHWADFDVAFYRLLSSGEIATVGPGVYQNLGGTVRRGVEASLNLRPTDSLTIGAVYGYADSAVTKNVPALLGKKVAGVPDVTATLNIAYTPIKPLTLNLTERYVGIYYADAGNTLRAPSFDLLDLGAAYALPTRRPIRLTLDLSNLLDRRYATAVFLSQGTELVSPAAPRAVRVGVSLDF